MPVKETTYTNNIRGNTYNSVSYEDDRGGEVTITTIDRDNFMLKDTREIAFRDSRGEIVLDGVRTTLPDNGREFIRIYDGIFPGQEVICDPSRSGQINSPSSVNVIHDVADSLVRAEIQRFAKDHPEIAARLSELKVPIAQYDGKPATMDQLLAAPANFRACPLDNEGNPKINADGERVVVERNNPTRR